MHRIIVHRIFSTTFLGHFPHYTILFLTVLMCLFEASFAACRSNSYSNRYFVSQPESQLIYLRDRSIKIACVVEFGVDATFVCNNLPIPETRLQKTNATKGVEISLTIGIDYIKNFENRMACQCIATKPSSGDVRVYRSKCVDIVRPYLEKSFKINPSSKEVAVGTTVRMRCQPPNGDPKPAVFWIFKADVNGPLKRIKNYGGRYQLKSGSDLLMPNVQIEDTGFYTCVAQNSASYRYSRKVFMRVYDNSIGTWSQWSDWTPCTSGSKLRYRNCQSNDATNCKGPQSETRKCATTPQTTTKSYILLLPVKPVRPTSQTSSIHSNQYSNVLLLGISAANLIFAYKLYDCIF